MFYPVHLVLASVCSGFSTLFSADRKCFAAVALCPFKRFKLLWAASCRRCGLPVNESDLLTVKSFHPQNCCSLVVIYFALESVKLSAFLIFLK